jgi:hypothetical protein
MKKNKEQSPVGLYSLENELSSKIRQQVFDRLFPDFSSDEARNSVTKKRTKKSK